MTKGETIKAIKALGLTAKCVDGEFRIAYGLDLYKRMGYDHNHAIERNEAQACYTDCAEDALATARLMNEKQHTMAF